MSRLAKLLAPQLFFILVGPSICVAEEPESSLRQHYRAAEMRILKALQKPVDMTFKNTPFVEVMKQLSKIGGFPYKLKLEAINEEGIDPDEPITMAFKAESIEQVFKRVLPWLGLAWRIDRGMVVVTTEIEDEDFFITRTYPVGKLLKHGDITHSDRIVSPHMLAPSPLHAGVTNRSVMIDGKRHGISHRSRGQWLKEAILEATDGAWSYTHGTGGTISILGNAMVVRQTYSKLRVVEQLLAALERATETDVKEPVILVHDLGDWHARNDSIRSSLQQKLSVSFEGDSLREVMSILEKHAGAQILLNEQTLSEEGVDPDTPIRAKYDDVTFDAVLTSVLEPLKLVYRVHGGDINVTTSIDDELQKVTVIYRVQELMARGIKPLELHDTIIQGTPGPWVDYPSTMTHPLPGILIVRAQVPNQRVVGQIISDLHRTTTPSPAKPKLVRRSYSLEKLANRRSSTLNNRDPIFEAIDAIKQFVKPLSWVDRYPGTIQAVGDVLIIEQTEDVHKKIEEFVKKHLAGTLVGSD